MTGLLKWLKNSQQRELFQQSLYHVDLCIYCMCHSEFILVSSFTLHRILWVLMPRLVKSFEAIAENLVEQDDFETLEIVGEDITLVAERVS